LWVGDTKQLHHHACGALFAFGSLGQVGLASLILKIV